MADKKINLDFHAKVQTDIGSIKDVVSELKQQLNSLEIPKSASKGFERSLESLNTELQNFEAMAAKGITSLSDTKKLDASWRKISTIFSGLGIQIRDLENTTFFPKEVSSNIEKANKALSSYQAKVEEIKKSQSYRDKVTAKTQAESRKQAATSDWQKEQKKLEGMERTVKANRSAWDQNRSKEYEDQTKQLASLNEQIEEQNKALEAQREIQRQLREAKVVTKEGEIRESHTRAIATAKAKQEELKIAKEAAKEQEQIAQAEEKAAKKASASAKGQVTRLQKKGLDEKDPKLVAAIEARTQAERAYAEAKAKSAEAAQNLEKIEKESIATKDKIDGLEGQSEAAKAAADQVRAIEEQRKALETSRSSIKAAASENERFKQSLDSSEAALQDQRTKVETYETAMKTAEQAVEDFNTELKQLELDGSADEWTRLTEVVKNFTGVDLSNFQGDISQITQVLEDYKNGQIKDTPELIKKLQNAASKATPAIKHMGDEADDTRRELEEMGRAEKEMENLKNQVLDFFSITNTIQIFKDAVRDAFETVKELDAAMTETAVVTDFSVGDMWDKLPEYSEEATKLGASIKSLYEATTLYYQQGLNSQQAMGVGIETMKMARIANMDAAQATEAMTAALRGFNMEINETSATRINDVYSELAAVTAADTSQIATAMSKTASIAESANMEFETTAALLAQIIETTQEAPETAGTAMKTIIARFTEVKQLFSEGMLTGEDSEGEEININKIDAALKTVGISLKDFLNGSKGIDDIFLELASKWDTLDLATQRYIATTAAGSRQQSRFLAMMSNYDRTMELVTAANNSAGASQKQFDKTTESLEAKIQRLKNAWAEFTMGLANSDVIKWAVDLLTDILNITNKITGLAGNDGLGGIITMFVRLATVITALRGGEKILNGILKHFSNAGFQAFDGKNFDLIGTLLSPLKQKAGLVMEGKGMGQTWAEAFKYAGFEGKKLLGILTKFGPYIALFLALAAAVNKVATSFKAAQKSAEMENLNNVLGELSEEAEQANSKLTEIGSDRSNLKNLQNTLKNLTKGTDEWKQALINTNQEVLNLIEKYPDLIDNLSTGTDGQLVISSEGWDEVYAKQQQLVLDLTNQKLATQAQISELQSSMDFDNFVIKIPEEIAKAEGVESSNIDKKVTEFELKLSRFLDSEFTLFGWDTGSTWGDIVAGINDAGYSTIGSSSALMPSTTHAQNYQDIKDQGGYVAITEREKTGGLTGKEYTAFAAALAEEGITLSDGMTESERLAAKDIYQGFGYDMVFFDPVIDKAIKLGNAFDELGNTVMSQQIKEEQVARNFVNNAVSGKKGVSELEYADAIANLITETRNYDKELTARIDAKEEELQKTYQDNNTLAKEYADRFGKYYADGKVYEDSSMEKEIPVIRDGMIEALATADITLEIQDHADQLSKLMQGKTPKQAQLFDDLFSSEGAEISAAQITKYQTKGEINYDQIAKDLGFENLKDMANNFGVSVEEITETLIDNFESATDRISKQRKLLAKRMTKYAIGEDDTVTENANDLAGLEEKFGEQIRYTLEDVFSSLEKTADFDIISQGFDYFKNVALSGTQDQIDELTNFIEQVNWSDSIESAYRLTKEIQNGTALTRGFAQTVMDVDAAFFSAGSQFQAFFASDVYKDVQEDLDEVYETQGKITEADVRELASEYAYLNKLLKNTSTTAEGLANILQGIEEGRLEFEDLTDAVIAAVGGMDSLGDATSKVLQRLQNIDLGDDLGEVQDIYTEFADKIKEFQEGGEYGNPQYRSILEYFFGKGFEGDRVGDDLINWYIQLGDQIEKVYGTDMYYGWEQAAKGMNIYGQAVKDQTAALKEYGIQLEMVNGQVVFNVPDDMTFEETATNLANVIGGTKEHWEDMITYFANRTPEMWRTWEQADYNQIGARVAETGASEVLGHKFVTDQDVDTIVTEASIKFADKDPEDIREEVEGQLADNEVEILTTLDTEDIAVQAEHIMSQLNNIFGGDNSFANQFIDNLNSGIASLDFSALMSAISALPIPENVGAQIANTIAQSVAELGGQITYEVEGETRTLDLSLVTNGTDFVEAINAQIAEAEGLAENAELDSTATVTIDQAAWQASVNSAKTYIGNVLSGLRYPISAYVSNVDTSAVTSNNTKNNTPSNPTSPKVGSLDWYLTMAADGDPGVTHKHDSLVGEEGPELIETKEGAYLSGVGGPQVTTLHRGDVVHTAEETQEIFKRKGVPLPSFSKGGSIGPAPISGGSGGSSKDDDEDTWENPFDKLYNLVRKIDEELRQRERIERRYEKLLESIDTSANKIISVSREELAQLERERMLQEKLQAGRRYQIEQYQSENADLTKYANVVQNDRGEDVLRINWDLINSVTDTDEGQRIEDYVSQLEKWFDSLEESEEALWDIEDAVQEIKERGEEEYFELEDLIKDSLTTSYQEEIDKLSAINDSINETNAALLDAIQTSIDKQRQDRDNQRTEDDLAEKQRRLLYLQQDTSGANAMEILRLQDEIAQGQEDYTDALIDQKISDLQEQNDQAAEQRDQQITLMQAQLDHYVKTGQIWQEVYGLMDEGLDADNGLVRGSRLEEILKSAEGYKGMSEIAKMEWMNDTNNMIAQALAYLEIGRQLEDIGTQSGSQIEFTTSDGRKLTGTVNEDGSVTASDGQTYNNVFQGYDGNYYAGENIADVEEPEVEGATNNQSGSSDSGSSVTKKSNPYGVASEQGNYFYAKNGKTIWGGNGVKAIQWALNDMGYRSGEIDGGYGYNTYSAVKRFQADMGLAADGDYGPNTREKMKLRGYKTGGLADFTGPAWLDGTKARPELVLNQKDTQNFIQLKDILASLMTGSHTSTENNGDVTYDIDINVESIGSDYDVEQVANKVKSLINEDARYRNNNAVSLKR